MQHDRCRIDELAAASVQDAGHRFKGHLHDDYAARDEKYAVQAILPIKTSGGNQTNGPQHDSCRDINIDSQQNIHIH
jgi:hypothetical protein